MKDLKVLAIGDLHGKDGGFWYKVRLAGVA